MIDLDTMRLPNVIVLPSYAVAGALLGIGAIVGHDAHRAVRAVIGMAVYYAFYFMITLITSGRGLGFGDVKLAGVLGLYLGWLGYDVLFLGYLFAALIGGAAALALVVFRGAGRKTRVPYGPFLVAGALVAVFAGAQVAHVYARTTGIS